MIDKALKIIWEKLPKQHGREIGNPMLLHYAPHPIDIIPVDGMIGAELFPDIRGTVEIPELLKEAGKTDGIRGAGKDAGEDKTTALQLVNNILGIRQRN